MWTTSAFDGSPLVFGVLRWRAEVHISRRLMLPEGQNHGGLKFAAARGLLGELGDAIGGADVDYKRI